MTPEVERHILTLQRAVIQIQGWMIDENHEKFMRLAASGILTEGGDAKQAPCEAPQSGGEAVTPRGSRSSTSQEGSN
jgi:hypothetical protein